MPRDARTYVLDIVDSCDAVASAIEGVDFESYEMREAPMLRVECMRELEALDGATAD